GGAPLPRLDGRPHPGAVRRDRRALRRRRRRDLDRGRPRRGRGAAPAQAAARLRRPEGADLPGPARQAVRGRRARLARGGRRLRQGGGADVDRRRHRRRLAGRGARLQEAGQGRGPRRAELTRPVAVTRAPGMPALLAMSVLGFSGYAALLPAAPLWAVHGGADEAGAGLVNGVLMLFTVLMQPFVPPALRRFGWGPVLAAGMVLLGLPALAHILSDDLLPVLALSAVRGLGFGILTVTG